MALSDAGGLLTAQHKRAQLELRAAALRDYLAIWPVWQGDAATFEQLIAAAVPAGRAHHGLSAAVSAERPWWARTTSPSASPSRRRAGRRPRWPNCRSTSSRPG